MDMYAERAYRMRWMDFDRYGRVQPMSVLDIFQDIATLQANEMGIGRDAMMEDGVFWAVVRQKYEIVREPSVYQVVTARTWPHTPTRFSFLRDYSMLDENGELLIKATSEWVLMDYDTRKFASVKDHYNGPTDFCEERSFERKPRKIADFDITGHEPYIVVPSYVDIDLNGHVNNAAYGNYVVNALNPGEKGAIKTFQIDYRHEAMPGEPLSVYTDHQDGLLLFKGVREDGAISFAVAIELA